MKSFENIDVKSVKEAVNLLQKFQQQKKTAAVVGGGSDYLQLMKDHVVEPDYLINLKTIPGLDSIKEERGAFRIGALAKLADIETHPAIQEKLLILSSAAGEAASPQIRNAGTIAGNLCQRPFCWYFRSANFACLRKGGQVCYTVTGDSRFQALEKFFVLPSVDYKHENILTGGEIVTEIIVPAPKPGSKGFYYKVRERLAWDHAIVAVATIVESSGGAVRDARVVMGGVAPIPWRAGKAEEFLRGKAINEANAKRAGEIALEGAKPLKDNSYKIRIAQDLIQRGLLASV
ncbi:MAG: FAD binding domain-containing protein [Deltaproteobacteria bacterium]